MPSIQDAISKAKTARDSGEDRRTDAQVREESRNRQAYKAGMATQQVQRIESAPRRVEQAAQAEQTNLMRDFERLQAGTPDEVRDWKGIAEATLYVSQQDDQEAQDLKNALLWTYGEQLRPHIEAAGGEDWWEENYNEMPEQDLPWYQDAISKAAPVFDYLDQWGQDGLGVAAGLKSATDTNDGVSAGDGIAHAIRSTARALDVTRAIPGTDGLSGMLQGDASTFITSDGRELSRDLDGDGTLNLREALGKDPEAGGRALGAIDLIGTIVLDPTTYVTFGGSSAAKAGMRAVEEAAERLSREGMERISREMAAEMNQRIARNGFKSLEEGEQQLYRSLLRTSAEMAFEATGRATTRLGRDLVAQQLSAVRRGGQSGMRLAGVTVAPTPNLLRRAPKEEFGRTVQGGAEGAGEVARRLDDIMDSVDPGGLFRAGEGTSDVAAAAWKTDDAAGRLAGAVGGEQDDLLRKLDELDDVAREQLDEVFLDSIRTGRFDDVVEKFSKLKPRVGIELRYGRRVADAVGELLSTTRASAQRNTSDLLIQIGGDIHKGKLLQSAIEEAGGKPKLFAMLDEALSNPARFDEIILEAGPQQTRLLRSLDDARTQIFEATLRGQGYSAADIAKMADGSMPLPDNMHDINTYIPRVLTGMVRNDGDLVTRLRRLTDDGTGTLGSRSDDKLVEGFMQRRSITDTDSVIAANAEVSAVLREAGIDAPAQMFETNIPAAFAVRSKSAFEAAAEVDLLDGLTELRGPKNAPLAVRLTPEQLAENKLGELLPDGLSKADFQRVELESGVVYYVQDDIAREMEDIRRVFGDPKELNRARDFYDKMNNAWAMSATVGLVNPGFHIRNMIGNWFNMFLGGVRDVTVLPRAAKLQKLDGQIRSRMAESGVDYATAARYLNADAVDLKILEGARRTGALGDSRTLDLTRAEGGRQAQAPTSQSLLDRANPLSADSVWNRKGVQVGETVEGNARLALYIDSVNKGMSPEAAAAHVKKYLFDYGDLTRFENETLRRFSRFYTFTRKNTALQFYALTRYPGRTANAQDIVDGAVQGFLDPLGSDEEGVLEGAAPDWMPNAITGRLPGTDTAAALAVDTPFNSFEELTSILTDLAKPHDPLNPESRTNAFFEKIDGLFSGVGVSAADFFAESSSGRDSFTGRPLGDQGRDHWLFRLVDTALPAVSRGERLAAQFGATRDGEAERDLSLMALNWLGGLQVAELDNDATGSQRSVLLRELTELQRELQDEYGAYDVETNPDGMMTLAQMRQQAELGEKDRIMNALLYSWETDANGELVWSGAAQADNLQELVPAEVLQALGIETGEDFRYSGPRDRAETDDPEVQAQRDERDLKTAMEAFEMWRGEPLTEEEKLTFLVSSPWAPSNTMLEGLGIEPYRSGNRFIEDGEEEPTYAAQLAEAETALERLANAIGLDASTVTSLRPRLSRFQRILNEAEAAGVPMSQLQDYITLGDDEGGGGVLSRNDRAFINQLLGYEDRMNGLIQISETRTPDVTAEDQRKIAEKAWEAEEEYVLFSQLFGLPRPSQEQIETYVANSIMTSGTLEDLGYTDLLGSKNRQDDRTEAEQMVDSQAVGEAMANRGPRSILFD